MGVHGVYVLELEDEKYYVGVSDDMEGRIEEHREGDSHVSWLERYDMKGVYETYPGGWRDTEKKITLLMMEEKGWENVRGGPWTQCEMNKPPKKLR